MHKTCPCSRSHTWLQTTTNKCWQTLTMWFTSIQTKVACQLPLYNRGLRTTVVYVATRHQMIWSDWSVYKPSTFSYPSWTIICKGAVSCYYTVFIVTVSAVKYLLTLSVLRPFELLKKTKLDLSTCGNSMTNLDCEIWILQHVQIRLRFHEKYLLLSSLGLSAFCITTTFDVKVDQCKLRSVYFMK